MALTAFHMQVAGIIVLVLVAVSAFWWLLRAAMGWHGGRPLYWLAGPAEDEDDEDPGSGDDH